MCVLEVLHSAFLEHLLHLLVLVAVALLLEEGGPHKCLYAARMSEE